MMDTGVLAVSVKTELMTFAEFEKLSDPLEGRLELHHGRIVHTPPRKKLHVQIQQALFDILAPLLRGRGFITVELPFRPATEYEAWVADIGFVSQARWDADRNDYFAGAPDLVIEVLSASNTMDEILARQDICLSNGCCAFWTVDSKRRIVMVTTPDRRTVTWDASMKIPPPPFIAEEMLIPVAAIFA
jgi:Uma2 family endonuclease